MLTLLFLFSLFRDLRGAPLAANDGGSISNTFPASYIHPRADIIFGTRSTFDIVTSCLATIFACTWTVIHPNIPSPADSQWDIFKRRLVMTVYALLAPEFITLWAYRQYRGAKNIMELYNKEISNTSMIQRDSESEPSFFRRLWGGIKELLSGKTSYHSVPVGEQQHSSRLSVFCGIWVSVRNLYVSIKQLLFYAPPFDRVGKGKIQPWTITHGFFVQMGGFMLCENGRPIQTLQFRGLTNRIRHNIIKAPKITQAEIEDRSKGDIISKTIVILQTTWFVAQCISRWLTRLPVTELEIITLGFAMLNGITYALWWHKPQNVGVPVYLEVKAQSLINSPNNDGPPASSNPEAESGIELPQMSAETVSNNRRPMEDSEHLVPKEFNDATLEIPSFLPRKLKRDWGHYTYRKLMFTIPKRLIQALLHPLAKLNGQGRDNSIHPGDIRVPMFFAETGMDSDIAYFLGVVATLFGCVHLVPSFFLQYASPTEMLLWRISATFITVQPLLASIGIASVFEIGTISVCLPEWIINFVLELFKAITPLYVVARLALVILALLSLRDLPKNAHHSINWISSIPHL